MWALYSLLHPHRHRKILYFHLRPISEDNGEFLIFVSWRLRETDNGAWLESEKLKSRAVKRLHCDGMHFHSKWLVGTKWDPSQTRADLGHLKKEYSRRTASVVYDTRRNGEFLDAQNRTIQESTASHGPFPLVALFPGWLGRGQKCGLHCGRGDRGWVASKANFLPSLTGPPFWEWGELDTE